MMSEQIVFYVSMNGSDHWTGRLAEPNVAGTDGPFLTLEAARDAVRKRRQTHGLPAGSVTVWLRGGDYVRTTPFELTEEDSGTPEAPVMYQAWPNETVCILGGRRLAPTAFTPVTDPAVRARLAEGVRDRVVQVDLRTQGVTDLGTFESRGFSRKTVPAHLELFVNDQPMTVAQWPDAGQFTTITGFSKPGITEWNVESGELKDGFTYDDDRPARWQPDDNIWVHGYWAYDWANSYERVRSLDTVHRMVETADPYGLYYFIKGQRFYFLNVLEELDQPGEYYVDQKSGILYLYPPSPLAGGNILVSELAAPILRLKDVSHVMFKGLTIEAGRCSGLLVEGGDGVRIEACVIRNMGNYGAIIQGGVRHVVSGCTIYGTGDGGIDVHGGDRATLTPCHHAVLNNHIHHIARWSRCYVSGVNADSVGIRIAHNHIHHLPHTAILFWGSEFLIEDNEIHHVCLETGDAGAIYTGRDYTFRGNVIRRNFIHHMGGVGMGSMAIYMDDCVSGTRITDNVLWECQIGLMLGGGRDFVVERNIFANCRQPIYADARGIDPNPVWQNMVNKTMKERVEAMRPHEPPYSTKYPEIADVNKYFAAGKGVPPEHNPVERNILFCSKGGFRMVTDGAQFDHNLYWCESGPVRFDRNGALAHGTQPFSQGDKAEAPCFTELGDVPGVTAEPGDADWAHWQFLGHDPNGVSADPLFRDPAKGDFRLKSGSPALALGFQMDRPLPCNP